MKLGLCSYSNRASGVGIIADELVRWLGVNSMLSVHSSKGQDKWLDRQVSCAIPNGGKLAEYLDCYAPDVLLGVETFFSSAVVDECRRRGIKTAVVLMHEYYEPGAVQADLIICPTQIAYERVEEPRKAYFRWPLDIKAFPFRQRTEARRWLHVVGHGVRNNRQQTREAIAGFLAAALPDATLTVHCQQSWQSAYGTCDDPRICYRQETLADPAAIYAGFDVLLQPDSFAGLNRVLYEAQSCGLPVITTDAPPMNEAATAALVEVAATEQLSSPAPCPSMAAAGRIFGATQSRVTPDAVAAACRAVAGSDIAALSRAGRAAVESRAWTKDKAAELLTLLERS